ncbi:hypothetical protein VKT23_020425 [Stygiomarasmius scandens]|uniref:Uncharacterized protein n=1 Tax=Marasmiellus scandens TaxID=2682957 RepID=A0ABR1ILN8_9AGAR
MSMINSAQVFSPRPSPNPLENLRVLKSPLKPFRNAAPLPSPIRKSIFSQQDLKDEEVVLVEGNCPRVVEEDKDLVILEHVEVPSARSRPPSPTKTSTTNGHTQALPSTQLLQLQAQQLSRPPKTPTRSCPSLHKAVLMRSAQKVVLSADVVEEEMEEEMEVLGALAEDEGDEREKRKLQDVGEEDEADEGEQAEGHSSWRKSIGNMWPFRLSASPTKPKAKEDTTTDASNSLVANAPAPIHGDGEEIDDDDETGENPAPLENSLYPPIPRFQIPAAPSTPRHSSSSSGRLFMTPQPQPSQVGNRFSLASRVSLGGDGPQRIKIEDQVWKVQDLMAQPKPSTSTSNDNTTGVGRGQPSICGWSQPPQAQTPCQKLSEEERNAIRERRRSALKNLDMFFGGIPGMGIASPVKASMSPSKSNGLVLRAALRGRRTAIWTQGVFWRG